MGRPPLHARDKAKLSRIERWQIQAVRRTLQVASAVPPRPSDTRTVAPIEVVDGPLVVSRVAF